MTFLMVKEPRKGGGEKSGLYESCPGQGPFLEIPVTFPAKNKYLNTNLKNTNAVPSQQTSSFCFVKW